MILATYGNTTHTISIVVIAATMGIHPGYTREQNLKGSTILGDWLTKIVS